MVFNKQVRMKHCVQQTFSDRTVWDIVPNKWLKSLKLCLDYLWVLNNSTNPAGTDVISSLKDVYLTIKVYILNFVALHAIFQFGKTVVF